MTHRDGAKSLVEDATDHLREARGLVELLFEDPEDADAAGRATEVAIIREAQAHARRTMHCLELLVGALEKAKTEP